MMIALLGGVLLACDTPTGPRLVAFERLPNPATLPTPQVFVLDGRLIIHALFSTPCEPYDATATVSAGGGALRLVVRGDASFECAQDVVGTFFYAATFTDPPAGSYRVRAVHTHADAAWPADSLDFGTVVLP